MVPKDDTPEAEKVEEGGALPPVPPPPIPQEARERRKKRQRRRCPAAPALFFINSIRISPDTLMESSNPVRPQGKKTLAFERRKKEVA